VFFIHHNYHHPAARRRRLLLGPTVLAAFFFGQRLRRLAWLILALPLTLLWLLYATPSAKAAGFTVNSTADGGDANPGDGICQTSTPGQCALRAAIEEANALGGADTINFDIPGSGPHTITPAGGLPAITKPVAIDGTSQPGFAGTPIIEIDGNNQAKDGFWLKPGSDGSTIRGFVINDFVGGSGIEIESSGNTIVGNYLGTNVAGTAVDGNVEGIFINDGANNIIGGTTAADANIISGNSQESIEVKGAGITGNVIQGNYIGTNSSGADLGNNGITANDAGDDDTGDNNLQNFAGFTSAVSKGAVLVTIDGSLNSNANTDFRGEFFASWNSGREADRYFGAASVTTDGSGNVNFSETFSAVVGDGEHITTTTTVDLGGGDYGDTSESSTTVNAPVVAHSMTVSSVSAALVPSGTNDFSLQFATSNGHVLGFGPSSILVASLDHMLSVDLVRANSVTPVSQDAAGEAGGSRGVAQPFTQVTYTGVWDGVTLEYTAVAEGIFESTYYIDGGRTDNPVDQIRLNYNRDVNLDDRGNLVIAYDTGMMTESAPVAWQIIDDQRKFVEVSYVLLDNNEVGFAVGDYDRNRQLVIDPTLTWNTFLGAGGNDVGYAIAVDGSGNVYVAGRSSATWGSPVRSHQGGSGDAFVAKLNSSGDLQWNTFLGADNSDYGYGIAVDSSGNIYVAGATFWTSWGSPVRPYTGGFDAFVAKLNGSGALQWNTFLGGSGNEHGKTITLDSSGNVYIGGYSSASWGSPVRAHTGGYDAFAAKLNSSGAL
jgi:CSLREA domain-containing protein